MQAVVHLLEHPIQMVVLLVIMVVVVTPVDIAQAVTSVGKVWL
jgi:Sec-independent protein translocase protein TatA